ncbi:MAG: M23 family metallopeptidase [Gaiellaceae bacterium]
MLKRLRPIAAAVAGFLLLVPFASGSSKAVPRIVFPVVGTVTYQNDFGDPRGRRGHQGNDIMAAKKSPAVAAEDGKVSFWTSSASAGCMLYLYGRSGTMYEYIHLNNDRTMRNDNRGKCVAGTAYAKKLKNGARVKAGQQIGFVGDSGDANGIASHLHFEVHPRGRAAVSPYRYLKRSRVLLFSAARDSEISLSLKGKLLEADSTLGTLNMRVTSLTSSGGLKFKSLSRKLMLELSPDTSTVFDYGADVSLAKLDSLAPGTAIEVETTLAPATLAAQSGTALALETSEIVIMTDTAG